MNTAISTTPSNQLLFPSEDIHFNIIVARNKVTISNNVNTSVNGFPNRKPDNIVIGAINNATCVPELVAIPIDNSSLFLKESIIALACSAAFPITPTITAPIKTCPNPISLAVVPLNQLEFHL